MKRKILPNNNQKFFNDGQMIISKKILQEKSYIAIESLFLFRAIVRKNYWENLII